MSTRTTAKTKTDYENHLNEHIPRWFAVYTKYKREKIVEKLLQEKGIQVYLPLQKLTRRWTRKIREVELPLFSCYIFVKITKPQYVPVLEIEHVVNFVKFSNNLISIPEEEIALVKRILGEGMEIDVEKIGFSTGDEVEIIAGNLTGLRGKLIGQHGKQKFLVELFNLGYSLQLSIDRLLLKRVGPSRIP